MGWYQDWQSIQNTPAYQDASDPEREAVRSEFFQSQIAPKYHSFERNEARTAFDSVTAPRGDPSSGVLSDAFKLVKAGAQQATADIAQGMTLGHKNAAADSLREWANVNMESLSPTTLRDVENFGIERDKESWSGFDFKEGSTLTGFLGSVAQGSGSLIPSMVPGGILGKGLGIAGKGLAGTNKAVQAAVQAKNVKSAKEALAIGSKIDNAAQYVGQSAAMGTMIMGGTANQTYEDVINQPESELMKSEQYRQYVQEARDAIGNDDPALAMQQARRRLAEEASLKVRGEAFMAGAASGLLNPIEMKLFKGAGNSTRRMGMLKSGSVEAVQETWESGAQQYLTNVAAGESGLERDSMENVAGAAATGALLGFAIGAPIGGVARPKVPLTDEQKKVHRDGLLGGLKSNVSEGKTLEEKLAQDDIDPELEAKYQEELEANYRQRYDIERQLNDLPPVPQTHDPVTADPERNHVPATIDEQINDAEKAKSDTEQALKREMKNGGNAQTVGRYEKSIGKQAHNLSIAQAMADNRGLSKFFNTKEEFTDWLIRSRKGGYTEFSAKAELAQRRNEYDASLKQQQKQQKQQKQAAINQAFGMESGLLEAKQQSAVSESRQAQQQRQSQKKQAADLASAKQKKAEQAEIESAHTRQNKIGRYDTFPVNKDTFAVSGSTPRESGVLRSMGGKLNSQTGLWEFPKANRKTVETKLSDLNDNPPPSKPPKYPKTSRKQERRALAKQVEEARAELAKLKAERKEEGQFKKDLLAERVRPAAQKVLEKRREERENKLNNRIGSLLQKIDALSESEEESGQSNRNQVDDALAKKKAAKVKAREEKDAQQQKDSETASKAEQQSKSEQALLQRRLDRRHYKSVSIGPYSIWTDNPDSFYVSGTTEAESAVMRSLKGFYNKDKSSWEFPKSNRLEIESQLARLSKQPQKQVKQKRQRVYPKTAQKRMRRIQAKGGQPNRGLGMRSVAEKEAELQQLKDEAKADKDFEHNLATHIYTDPVTGKQEPVEYVGSDIIPDMDMYLTKDGQEVSDNPRQFKAIHGAINRVSDLEVHQQKEQEEAAAEDEAARKQALLDEVESKRTEERQKIIDEQNKLRPYPEEEATHVYTPKGGKPQLIKPIEQGLSAEAGGMGMGGWYRRPDGKATFLGDRERRIKSLKEIEADKKRQQEAARKEEEKERKRKEAEDRAQARAEAAHKKRHKNKFLDRDSFRRLPFTPGESANLYVKGEKGSFYLADVNGKRLTDEDLTTYIDTLKEDKDHRYPVEKIEKDDIAKINQKNLADKPLIGNGKGDAWTRYSDAKAALNKKGLQDTHYVTETKNNHYLKKIPDFSDLSWETISYERNGAIETIMVPSKEPTREQREYIQDIAKEKFTSYKEPADIVEQNVWPDKGQAVIRLRKSNPDTFRETLNPPDVSTKPEKVDTSEKPVKKIENLYMKLILNYCDSTRQSLKRLMQIYSKR